jgi:hypothetical protein
MEDKVARLDAGGERPSANAATAGDYSRVRMKIMANSEKIAVTLQKTCKACSLREGRLPLAPVNNLRAIGCCSCPTAVLEPVCPQDSR